MSLGNTKLYFSCTGMMFNFTHIERQGCLNQNERKSGSGLRRPQDSPPCLKIEEKMVIFVCKTSRQLTKERLTPQQIHTMTQTQDSNGILLCKNRTLFLMDEKNACSFCKNLSPCSDPSHKPAQNRHLPHQHTNLCLRWGQLPWLYKCFVLPKTGF